MFGKDAKKKELIKNLDNLYGQIQREHQISPGDFPDIKTMQEKLQHQDFTKFKLIDQRFLTKVINFFLEFPICPLFRFIFRKPLLFTILPKNST